MTISIKAGEEFLGIGLFGPLRISHTGEFQVKAGLDLVIESVRAILSTNSKFKSQGFFVSGERFMRDDFGTPFKPIRHENLDESTMDLVEAIYVDSIEKWEPRAVVKGITTRINEFEESLTTEINVSLVGTNQTGNLVVIRDKDGRVTTALPETI